MLREEAIEYGTEWLKDEYLDYPEDREFINMALEVLKREPCDNCISKAEAMRAITDVWVHTHGKHTLEGFTDAIYNLPAVTPERVESEGADDQR